jgi:D-glycero-D-manno-heptose 1,7-bisphosphate phosphatase
MEIINGAIFEHIAFPESEFGVFVDLDGTLQVNIGYNAEFTNIQFFKNAIEKLREYSAEKKAIFIVTNQSGIERNFFTLTQMLKYHQDIVQFLRRENIRVNAIMTCPHMPDPTGKSTCQCRKPAPFMIRELERIYELNLQKCIFIGDSDSDQEAAEYCKVTFFRITVEEDWKEAP